MPSLEELNAALKKAVGDSTGYINANDNDDITLDGHFTIRQLEHVVMILQIHRKLTNPPER